LSHYVAIKRGTPQVVILDVQAKADSLDEALRLLPSFPGARVFDGWEDVTPEAPAPKKSAAALAAAALKNLR
jgi:hypothetical protein